MEEIKPITLTKYFSYLALLALLTVLTSFAALSFGSVHLPVSDIFNSIFNFSEGNVNHQIVLELRLPRILLAVAVGGGLSVAGAVFQAILMNPLAEPYILGVSSGGTFGAVFAILFGMSFIGQQALAFSGALFVIFIVFSLGRRFGVFDPTTVLLVGVMVGSFFSALILLMMTYIDGTFRSALFWLLGNLSLADPASVYYVLPAIIVFSIILSLFSQKINVLSLGDESAKHLGINSTFIRNISYIISSLIVGVAVSVSGIVGFVGLLVPHLCRILFGSDNRIIIPASFFLGAVFLIVADTIARIIISPSEMPVGVVTALVGSPIFIYLLRVKITKQ